MAMASPALYHFDSVSASTARGMLAKRTPKNDGRSFGARPTSSVIHQLFSTLRLMNSTDVVTFATGVGGSITDGAVVATASAPPAAG